jgi:hypothetical protein
MKLGLKKAWQLLTSESVPIDAPGHRRYFSVSQAPKDVELKGLYEIEIFWALEPLIVVGPAHKAWKLINDESSLRFFVEADVELRCGDTGEYSTKDLSKHFLAEHPFEFTNLLVRCMQLFALIEQASHSADPSTYAFTSVKKSNQTEFARSWTLLIELARDSFDLAIIREKIRGQSILAHWISLDFPVFKRLSLHAVTEHSHLDVNDAVILLLKNNAEFLWSTATRRECLRFLRKAGNRILPDDARNLEQAILKGPPRNVYRSDLSTAEFESASTKSIWHRLAKLVVSGAELSSSAQSFYEKHAIEFEGFLQSDHRDEFLSWSSGFHWESDASAKGPEQGTRERRNDRLKKMTVKEITDEVDLSSSDSDDDIRYLCLNRPHMMHACIREVTKQRPFDQLRWQVIYETLRSSTYRDPRRIWLLFSKPLLQIGESDRAKQVAVVANWLEVFSKKLKTEDVDQLAKLIEPLCSDEALVQPKEEEGQIIARAINTPPGILVLAVINAMAIAQHGDGRDSGLPPQMKGIFDRVVGITAEAGLLVRTMLCAALTTIFWLDSKWAQENLIDKMDWSDARLSACLWTGYLWSPRYFADLIAALKKSMLQLPDHKAVFEKYCDRNLREVYFDLVAQAFLDYFDLFDKAEIISFRGKLDTESLEQICRSISRRLERNAAVATDLWSAKIQRLLNVLWPPEPNRQNPRLSCALAKIALLCRESAPAATEFALPYIVGGSDGVQVLRQVRSDRLVTSAVFPFSKLLVKLLPKDLDRWHAATLQDVLKILIESDPTFQSTSEYAMLRDLANQ